MFLYPLFVIPCSIWRATLQIIQNGRMVLITKVGLGSGKGSGGGRWSTQFNINMRSSSKAQCGVSGVSLAKL